MFKSLAGWVIGFSLLAACSTNDGSEFDESVDPNEADDGTLSGGFEQLPSVDQTAPELTSCAATVVETEKAKVDIIFAIDGSGSMHDEMTQVKENINEFAAKIDASGLDYRVIVISTRGTAQLKICVPPPLASADCGDNPPTFYHVNTKVGSYDSLKFILSTYESTWKNYIRPKALKVFVEVTDDEAKVVRSGAFDKKLLAYEGHPFGTEEKRNYVFHSIVNVAEGEKPPSAKRCYTKNGGTGVEYQKLSVLTGGIVDAVCKKSYADVLDNIAKSTVDRLACELTYPTADAADPTSLVVRYTPNDQASSDLTQVTDASKCESNATAWYYDDNDSPTKIILCNGICDAAASQSGSKVEALVGCKAPAPK